MLHEELVLTTEVVHPTFGCPHRSPARRRLPSTATSTASPPPPHGATSTVQTPTPPTTAPASLRTDDRPEPDRSTARRRDRARRRAPPPGLDLGRRHPHQRTPNHVVDRTVHDLVPADRWLRGNWRRYPSMSTVVWPQLLASPTARWATEALTEVQKGGRLGRRGTPPGKPASPRGSVSRTSCVGGDVRLCRVPQRRRC